VKIRNLEVEGVVQLVGRAALGNRQYTIIVTRDWVADGEVSGLDPGPVRHPKGVGQGCADNLAIAVFAGDRQVQDDVAYARKALDDWLPIDVANVG